MMYEYLELADKTLVTHSQIIEKDGQKFRSTSSARKKADLIPQDVNFPRISGLCVMASLTQRCLSLRHSCSIMHI